MNDWTANNPFLGQNNPFLQQVVDNASGDVVRNYNLAVKPQTESAMVNSGSFGNSGLMQMQGEQQRQLGDTLGKVSTGLRAQDYGQQQQMYQWDQNFNRGLFNDGFDQNRAGLQDYMGLLSTANQFGRQGIQDANTLYQQPLQYLQAFSGMANQAGGMGQTGTNTQNAQGSPIAGAIGGWGLGGQIGNWWNKGG